MSKQWLLFKGKGQRYPDTSVCYYLLKPLLLLLFSIQSLVHSSQQFIFLSPLNQGEGMEHSSQCPLKCMWRGKRGGRRRRHLPALGLGEMGASQGYASSHNLTLLVYQFPYKLQRFFFFSELVRAGHHMAFLNCIYYFSIVRYFFPFHLRIALTCFVLSVLSISFTN